MLKSRLVFNYHAALKDYFLLKQQMYNSAMTPNTDISASSLIAFEAASPILSAYYCALSCNQSVELDEDILPCKDGCDDVLLH